MLKSVLRLCYDRWSFATGHSVDQVFNLVAHIVARVC